MVEDRRTSRRGLRRRSSGSQEDVREEERLARPGEEVAPYRQSFTHRQPLALSYSGAPTTSMLLVVHLDAKLKVD